MHVTSITSFTNKGVARISKKRRVLAVGHTTFSENTHQVDGAERQVMNGTCEGQVNQARPVPRVFQQH